MSAKGSLPDSLELLLDTMCNTFGGVMFITLSLAVLLSLCSKIAKNDSKVEVKPEDLVKIRQENEELEAAIADLQRDIEREEATIQTDNKAKQKYLENKRLARERQQKQYERDQLVRSNKEKTLRFVNEEKRLLDEKRLNEAEIAKEDKRLADARGENGILKAKIEVVKKNIKNTKEKSIHFAHNESESRMPVWIVVSKNSFYRIDTMLENQDQIKVVRDGDTFLLMPQKGYPISKDLSVLDTQRLLAGFPKERYHCGISVMPDSMEASVYLRRNLRSLGYKVSYYVSSKPVLRATANPDYSSSD